METINPNGGHLSDASKQSVKHAHLIKNTGTEESSVWTEDTAVEDIAFASVVSAGKCGLTIESSQYSSDDTAGLSYWGHRATYDYAEIIQADTQTSIAFTHADGTEIAAGETVDKADRLTYTGYGHAPPRQHGNGQRARRRSHHLRRPHQHGAALYRPCGRQRSEAAGRGADAASKRDGGHGRLRLQYGHADH